jgi:hypothetical protein
MDIDSHHTLIRGAPVIVLEDGSDDEATTIAVSVVAITINLAKANLVVSHH